MLCGGRSTRMGTSKALLDFGGETMLQRVVRLLGSIVSPVVVVAAPHQPLPDLPSPTIVTRDQQEGLGPLEGLRRGLEALPDTIELAYATGCDVPLLAPGFARRMIELAAEADITSVRIDGVFYPLPGVYRVATVLPAAERLLAAERRRVGLLFESLRVRAVPPMEIADTDPQLLSLRNVNTRQDYVDAMVTAGVTIADTL